MAETSVVEPIEEEEIFQEYADEEDDGLEIELHESQTKVAEQSAALLTQQAHLHSQETAMIEMQKMVAMMSAMIAMIASPKPVVPPQAPSASVAPTPPLSTRARLTFPGYGEPQGSRPSMMITPSTAPLPMTVSYRSSDVALFKVVGIQRGSVDDIKFSMWNFNNAVATVQ